MLRADEKLPIDKTKTDVIAVSITNRMMLPLSSSRRHRTSCLLERCGTKRPATQIEHGDVYVGPATGR
jgi:hypothetical protein